MTWKVDGRWVLAKATAVVTFNRPVRSVELLCCSSVSKMEGFVEDVSTTNPEAYSASLANVVFVLIFFCLFFTLGPIVMAYFHQGRRVSTY